MKLRELIDEIEKFAPPALQESYDNSGLLTGHPSMEITGALVCLDSTEEVIREAVMHNCNLVIAHHPIIFSGLKRLTGKNYVERAVITAIKNDIAIYACHTNMDNVKSGVNAKIAEKLGMRGIKILSPKAGFLKKLVTFCPHEHAEKVRLALFAAGAGHIGNYDSCSYNVEGTGTFRAGDAATPFVGRKGEIHYEKETRLEVILEGFNEKRILGALIRNHPYEEVAYDIYPLSNVHQGVGSGMVGEIEKEMTETEFLELLKSKMKTPLVRHTALLGKPVRKVAVCGGSGSFLLKSAKESGADVFVTGDFKYHEFFDAEGSILIADIGHFESEQFICEIFYDLIKKKFPTFAVRFSGIQTNPVNYF